ncbi:MAG: MarR family transcriptional regulator [Alphaproteobacteria bacterium]|nr:MAG: MarR family transcriptional regulator [Alphaproteobacteria bacterium]TAF76323.1 MAG: MarR family transcriptional regulator [Alphaproteobacteria bacterium]
MKPSYIELTLSIERLHRRFLDVVKSELDRLHIEDINNVQTLILYNIGTEQITIGELTNRGYYLGSNVSYNVKKLVDNEYLVQERASHDKRSVKIKLSAKGLDLCAKIDGFYHRHMEQLGQSSLNESQQKDLLANLEHLEQFWTGQLPRI